MSTNTGGGGSVGGDVGAGRDFIGRDETDHRNSMNVYFDSDRPLTPSERADWRDRQIAELRYALLGDKKFGVSGLVDTVYSQRIWFVILAVLVALVALVLIWQQVQIHQIQFQMQ